MFNQLLLLVVPITTFFCKEFRIKLIDNEEIIITLVVYYVTF